MSYRLTIISIVSLGLVAGLSLVQAQTTANSKSLLRGTLSERFSPVAAEGFLAAMEANDQELHSIMIVKDAKVVYERWFGICSPFGNNAPAQNHPLWSVSKTWTCMAVGLAIAEGKFTVEDKVIDFFPDDQPEVISENLNKLRVKHLLSFSVGHEGGEPKGLTKDATERWEKIFLAHPIVFEPGTRFAYNSHASYMLSSIVQKTTGQRVIDYLKPRLLDPLGIEGVRWEDNKQGVNIGGVGLVAKTEDMAKLGLLLLQKGRWNDRQIIPEAWVEEATTRQVQKGDPPGDRYMIPYCYQIWRCRDNGFLAFGNLGQFIIVLPEQNAVIVLTGKVSSIQMELKLVWEHLLPALFLK